ncbi:MAG: elongator complex protein 3 [Oscillospiraceae bacterium]|jgi:histone acetyltransferase (RNA polymerase elongator complex component)
MTAKKSIIPVFVPHLGCPANCVFCDQRKISGSVQPADAETVRRAVLEGLAKNPTHMDMQLAFYGGSFTAIPVMEQEALLDAALPFLLSGELRSVRLSTRPDAIDEETLDRLRRYGVKTIELGAQSMDDEVLRRSGRGHTAAQTETAARLIKNAGFELILQMMTGLPGDTKEKTTETARRLIALSPDGVRVYPTVIVEGTPLEALWRRGEYREHTVDEAVDWCATILPLFAEAGIPVIRLGLNPTEELTGGEAIAGAYHPAFGELVRSRILLERARALLRGAAPGTTPVLLVNKSDVSAMIGQHRANIDVLCRAFAFADLKVRAAELPRGEIKLL